MIMMMMMDDDKQSEYMTGSTCMWIQSLCLGLCVKVQ